MRAVILIVLSSIILGSAAAPVLQLPSNVTLGHLGFSDGLPDDRFRIGRTIEAPFLPVDTTLINVLFVMGLIGVQDQNAELDPQTWSAPGYNQVEIQSFAYTEARFVLWGAYFAILDMIDSARFHNTVINLYWEDQFVGRMKFAVKATLSLPGGNSNNGENLSSGGQQIIEPTDLENSTHTTVLGAAPSIPADIAGNATAENYTDDLRSLWSTSTTNHSALSSPSPVNDRPTFTVDIDYSYLFRPLKRNDVFLTFFLAIIHASQFDAHLPMSPFETRSPLGNSISLKLSNLNVGCCYGAVINLLTYVPKFMAEHPSPGYWDLDFVARTNYQGVCKGELRKSS
ncbi:hypothetical protein ACLMJK_001654 [Lecanora helva]